VYSYNARHLETARDLRSCDITNPFRLVMSQTLCGLLFLPNRSGILAASAPKVTHNRNGMAFDVYAASAGRQPPVAAQRRKDMSTKAPTHQTGALLAYWRLLTAIFRHLRMPTITTLACATRQQSLPFDHRRKRIDCRVIWQDDINTAPRRWGMKVLPIP